ncbi:MAG: hypothetical protein AVDCRST_MAG68-971 [uncultured Gemmatimonadetes bacterium]|uniref:Uncharacterized protein n=1 Tax=uncultured Gemmatimonadota bacterium TaxID=203437 RepID=A0A6J4KJN7_9BACT|nr:MAG: hypothetical protein AVDCRST_MAG68-971 [uncultured Gemmatimonadota bacterium]
MRPLVLFDEVLAPGAAALGGCTGEPHASALGRIGAPLLPVEIHGES